MREKIKKFLYFLERPLCMNKKVVVFALVAIFLIGVFILTPTHRAQAALPLIALLAPILTGVASSILYPIVQVIFVAGIILAFDEFLLRAGQTIISWAVNNPYGLSFTNPTTNPIIAIGWPMLRDITNMLFVLGLAYIGLATALNMAGFNTKKAFATLLLVAVLVNFTPVICGAIVDVSNLILKFFLPNPDFSPLIEIYKLNLNNHKSECSGTGKWFDPECWAKAFVLNSFGFVGGVLLCIYGLLLAARYVAIWILTIISPLAFFALIFDKTQGYFSSWWKQFINWSFIAVPAGFFLYLSEQMLAMIWRGSSSAGGGSSTVGILNSAGSSLSANVSGALLAQNSVVSNFLPSSDFMSGIAPYFVVILFLGFSLVASKRLGAVGASGILNLASKARVKGLAWSKGVSKKYLEPALKKGAIEVGSGAGGAVSEAIKGGGGGGGVKGVASGFFRGMSKGGRDEFKQKTWRGLEAIGAVDLGRAEKEATKRYNVAEQQKGLGDASDERLDELIERGSGLGANDQMISIALAALKQKAENNDWNDNATKKVQDLTKKGIAVPSSVIKAIIKTRPDLENLVNPEARSKKIKELEASNISFSGDEALKEKMVKALVTIDRAKKISAEDFYKNVSSDSYNDINILLGLDERKIKTLFEKGSEKQYDALSGEIIKRFHDIQQKKKDLKGLGLLDRRDEARINRFLTVVGREVGKNPDFSTEEDKEKAKSPSEKAYDKWNKRKGNIK